MLGYRKLIALAGLTAVAVIFKLTPEQADVIKTLGIAYLGSNAVVSIGQAINGKISNRNTNGSNGSNSTPVAPIAALDETQPH